MKLRKIMFEFQYTGDLKKEIVKSIEDNCKDWNLKPNEKYPYIYRNEKLQYPGHIKTTNPGNFEVVIYMPEKLGGGMDESPKKSKKSKKKSENSTKHWTQIVKEIQEKEGITYAEAKEIYKNSK